MSLVKEAVEKEWTEWTEEKIKSLAEVENLKKQAEDLAKVLPASEEEDDKIEAEMHVDEDVVIPAAADPAPVASTAAASGTGGDPVEY